MLGNLISAGANLASNYMSNMANKKAMQFGVRWRVADAKAAGIHPLAALGANIQSIPSQPLLGDSTLAGLAEGINKATAPQTEAERLANEESRARIRNTEAQTMESVARSRTIAMGARQPPGAVVGSTARPGSRDLGLGVFGTLSTDPSVADAQAMQDRYGDIVENIHGLGIAFPHDLYRSLSAAYADWVRTHGVPRVPVTGRNRFGPYRR